MNPHARFIAGTSIVLVTLACSNKPSASLTEEFKKALLGGNAAPKMQVKIGTRAEGDPYVGQENLHHQMTLLASTFGFRIEVSTVRRAYLPATKVYEIQGFNAPTMSGVTFKQDGQVVTIEANRQVELVIEEAGNPEIVAKPFLDQQALILASMAGKENEKISHALSKASATEFAKNVERIRRDQGYPKAYLFRFRKVERTSVPEDSPLWELAEATTSIVPNSHISLGMELNKDSTFWSNKGKSSSKDALSQNLMVVFTDNNGKLAKMEGWQTFIAN